MNRRRKIVIGIGVSVFIVLILLLVAILVAPKVIDSEVVKAKMQDGKLRYDEAVLHGHPMTVTAAGEHDLQNGRFDLTLLVAPLVTLDRIFEHIPLIGGILEALDTIPIGAKGTLDNIHIYPLAPSAVGYELAEMMKKTVERPINLIHAGKGSGDRGQRTEHR